MIHTPSSVQCAYRPHADFQAQQGLADKPLIDKEIGEVLATHDETQRQALYRDILTRLHDEAVYLPISYISMMWYQNRSWVTSPTRRSPPKFRSNRLNR
ncbi:nickel ABC transporter, substrate-binding protein [Escherichia coli]|nr:nickel ABC transporter, substrate-binding protein [Escherichia coli]